MKCKREKNRIAQESCLRTLFVVSLLLRSQDQQRVLSSLFLAPQLSTLQDKLLAVLPWNWNPTLPSPDQLTLPLFPP
jgi:hypothetical protein